MAFEIDFESEMRVSGIKPMICRRFSLFWFSGFIDVLSVNNHNKQLLVIRLTYIFCV